jgi:hypothetical protein
MAVDSTAIAAIRDEQLVLLVTCGLCCCPLLKSEAKQSQRTLNCWVLRWKIRTGCCSPSRSDRWLRQGPTWCKGYTLSGRRTPRLSASSTDIRPAERHDLMRQGPCIIVRLLSKTFTLKGMRALHNWEHGVR